MDEMSRAGESDFVKKFAAKAQEGEELIAKKRRELDAEKERMRRRVPPPTIPRRFQNRRLANYKPRNQSQMAALSAVRSWVAAASGEKGPMLALIGPKGVGKSHLLYGAAWELYEAHSATSFARPWYRLADELRYGEGERDERGEPKVRSWEVRRRLYEARIVLLDELRPTSGTDLDATELAKFACHAYDDETAVLVTTNWASLEEVMGEPAADRFTKVVIVGESARHALAAEKAG